MVTTALFPAEDNEIDVRVLFVVATLLEPVQVKVCVEEVHKYVGFVQVAPESVDL